MIADAGPVPRAPVAVVGAGSWGTALAIHLGRLGAPVRLWARDRAAAAAVEGARENRRYLPGLPLPSTVRVTPEAPAALDGAGLVLVAVPSAFLAAVLDRVGARVPARAVLVSATKGLEPASHRRPSQVLADALPGRGVVVLSGPSFAREVALGRPTALVVASRDPELARGVQQALAGPAFRLYTNRDVVGVEMGGALKNVVAIAAGLADSLELGENARAALITRGLAEMVRLGVALGARASTFAGLAGLGDLVLTATGSLSRNRALGLAVGRGASPEAARAATPMVAEGVGTVSVALALAARAGVAMPIAEAVASVLFRGIPPAAALQALLGRELRAEEEDPFAAPGLSTVPGRGAGERG